MELINSINTNSEAVVVNGDVLFVMLDGMEPLGVLNGTAAPVEPTTITELPRVIVLEPDDPRLFAVFQDVKEVIGPNEAPDELDSGPLLPLLTPELERPEGVTVSGTVYSR